MATASQDALQAAYVDFSEITLGEVSILLNSYRSTA